MKQVKSPGLAEHTSKRPHEFLNNLTPEEHRQTAENPAGSKSAWN
ncbi:hypothetical protein N2K17_02725 [Klebsiella michiganensis]|nr:hypothetical protein [Klebsiella michiganensis]MCX3078652.1 hypothetical protein [Klebsiella michiganensis]MCY0817943.1 hypothetical protein [Klebsiella michiganensis]